jgi:hypothetical protein
MKEMEELPVDFQVRILKLVHFLKEEFFMSKRMDSEGREINALSEVDKIAIETGISDLARHHDHYLYGTAKK